MRKFVADIIAVAMLIGTEAWFLKGYFSGQPEFEPGLAFLGAFGVILAKDPILARLESSRVGHDTHDRALYQLFLDALPPNPTTTFFNAQDFATPFRRSSIEPLYSFVNTWGSVDKEFLDQDLEARKKAVYAFASELANEIAARTAPMSDGVRASVFTDRQSAVSQQRPDSVIEDSRILNRKAAQFVPLYEDFVRVCRARLEK